MIGLKIQSGLKIEGMVLKTEKAQALIGTSLHLAMLGWEQVCKPGRDWKRPSLGAPGDHRRSLGQQQAAFYSWERFQGDSCCISDIGFPAGLPAGLTSSRHVRHSLRSHTHRSGEGSLEEIHGSYST